MVETIPTDFDFGFSCVSSDELTAGAVDQYQRSEEKFNTLYNMVMPLLKNLKKDPDRDYILWPDRITKIDQFIKKINAIKGT
jgi:hypothetical protein